MDQGFQLFPDRASSIAGQVDALYFFLLGVSAFFTVLIFVAIVFLALYYRRSAVRNRTRGRGGKVWLLEVAWIVVPLALTMVMFGWGAQVYFDVFAPPPDAIELQVVGKQWMWKIQHPNGRGEINELHVPTGQPIRLRMISEDVIHSFYIPAFRVKMDVLPGRYTSLWFEATEPGEYHLFCAEYCGTDHADMSGRVVVMQPADYVEWLSGESSEAPQTAGQKLFTQMRCHTCHRQTPDGRCPSLHGLYGSTVPLADGRTVQADASYLREAILDPLAKITAGYQPLMPTYRGQLSEQQVLHLIEYIKSLPDPGAESMAPVPAADGSENDPT